MIGNECEDIVKPKRLQKPKESIINFSENILMFIFNSVLASIIFMRHNLCRQIVHQKFDASLLVVSHKTLLSTLSGEDPSFSFN